MTTMDTESHRKNIQVQTDAMKTANCVTPDAYLARGERNRDEDGNAVLTSMHERRIRRLTEIEVERLQGFPDNWTDMGIYEKKVWNNQQEWLLDKDLEKTFTITEEVKKITKTQRYKLCGNAVMVDCVKAIALRLNANYPELL